MANCLPDIVISTTGEPAKGCCVMTLSGLGGLTAPQRAQGQVAAVMKWPVSGKARSLGQASSLCSPTLLNSVWCGYHKFGVWLVLTTKGGAGSGEAGWLM